MKYALIDPQNNRLREADERRIDPAQIAGTDGLRSGYKWLPIVTETRDDSTTAHKVADPMVETIEADRVHRLTVIRDKTAQELEAEVQAEAEDIVTNSELMAAMSFVTVKLVKIAVDNPGQISSRTEAEIRQLFRDRVVEFLRTRKGL